MASHTNASVLYTGITTDILPTKPPLRNFLFCIPDTKGKSVRIYTATIILAVDIILMSIVNTPLKAIIFSEGNLEKFKTIFSTIFITK